VLTDGRINVGPDGELFKSFDVTDGLGIAHWTDSGGEFAIITGRRSDIVEHRAGELGIEEVFQGISDKWGIIQDIVDDRPFGPEEVAYIGDDISDIEALEGVGRSCCPADAISAVQTECDYVSGFEGGRGAVRDILTHLKKEDQTVLGVIPARYGSTRLPGKPLIDLCGKPMVQHVYERAMQATTLDEVIVATDDDRIVESIESVGGKAMLTSSDHPTGTDRVAEIARQEDYDVTVNIQGDEPLIEPGVIDATVNAVKHHDPSVATPISPVNAEFELEDENTVKVVTNEDGRALYFSRSRIPSGGTIKDTEKHIGLYAFETGLLLRYVDMESTLEAKEDLEQLRLLENGYEIQTASVDYDAKEVNIEDDVQTVERIMRENNDR
jgi:3-deoxy-D-manno-octulosonate cytidylyltransferase